MLPDPASLAALAADASLSKVKTHRRSGVKLKNMLSIAFYLSEDETFDAML